MNKKKALKASQKKLKQTVKELKSDLDIARAKAVRWKKQAKRSESTRAASQARMGELETRLAKSQRSALSAADPSPEVTPLHQVSTSPTPDDTWTVAALRAEARSRGLAGYSRRSKSDLIAALT